MYSAQLARDDEAPLIERLRRNDQRAWRMFFSQHSDRIHKFCYSMLRNREDAQDATQDVLRRMATGLGSFKGESSLNTWVFTIARNVCLNHIDAGKRSGKRDSARVDVMNWTVLVKPAADALEEPKTDEIAADRSAASHQLRVAIARAMAALDPVFRIAIYLREVEGFSYAEIAGIEKIPIETVKTRIYRARMELQRSLAEYRP